MNVPAIVQLQWVGWAINIAVAERLISREH
jgi:hypothetical protein